MFKRCHGSYFLLFMLLGIMSCSYTEKIKDGNTAFERKRYFQAIELWEEDYGKIRDTKERAKTAFLIGQSYTKIADAANAAKWFKLAYDQDYGTPALDAYAQELKKLQKYGEAAQMFRKLAIETRQQNIYNKEIIRCKNANEWLKEAPNSPYEVSVLPEQTAASEYPNQVFSADRISVTTDRESNNDRSYYAWTGNKFYTVGDMNPKSGKLTYTYNELAERDADLKEGSQVKVFTRCKDNVQYDQYCQLYISYLIDEEWTEAEKLSFCEEETNYINPSLNVSDDILIFSSDMATGKGGYDLYVSRRVADFEWSVPEPLPGYVNTAFDEVFPFMKGDSLYFSSNASGMGGLDIFLSYLLNDQFVPPINLKAPMNSGADDFAFVTKDKAARKGYFASNRRGQGKYGDDIFAFKTVKRTPKEEENELITRLRINTNQYQYKKGGRVSVPLKDVALSILSPGQVKSIVSNENGYVILEINPSETYSISANNDGFLKEEKVWQADAQRPIEVDKNGDRLFETTITLDPIRYDEEITIDNIYYDFDDYRIREDAKPALDQMFRFLRDNPTLRIELAAHTDCQGEDSYNLDLSAKRAASVTDYLIARGVSKSRLQSKGYGETKPIETCECESCTEEQHQANRRTTFKILRNN